MTRLQLDHRDRQIHARTDDDWLIVRYDRAGKWYAERAAERRPLTLGQAVQLATEIGSHVYLGRPGGRTFDAVVKRMAKHV